MVIGCTWRRPLHHRQELPSIDEGEDNGDVMAKASEQHNRPEEKAYVTPGLTEVLGGEKFCLLTWFQFKEVLKITPSR